MSADPIQIPCADGRVLPATLHRAANPQAAVVMASALGVPRRRASPQEVGVKSIGHLGFFKDTLRDTLWRETADWILATAQGKNHASNP